MTNRSNCTTGLEMSITEQNESRMFALLGDLCGATVWICGDPCVE